MKILNRYKKLLIRISCSFIVLMLSICSFSFTSKAADYSIYMSRPQTSDNSGYLEVLFQNKSTGDYLVQTFFWNQFESVIDGASYTYSMDINITTSKIEFIPGSQCCLLALSSDGRDVPIILAKFNETYTFTASAYNFIAYKVYGNYGNVSCSFSGYKVDWNVLYTEDYTVVNRLVDIYNQLVQANSNDTTIINILNNILSSVDTAESKLEKLELLDDLLSSLNEIGNSVTEYLPIMSDKFDEFNSWLIEIYDLLNEQTVSDDEKANMEDFKENSQQQGEELNDLNEQNKVDKEDVGDLSDKVEPPKEEEPPSEEEPKEEKKVDFNQVIITITGNEFVSQALITVLGIALIGYVLFGKR